MSTRPTYTLRQLIVYIAAWAIAIGVYVPFARRLNLPWWSVLAVAAGGAFVGFFWGYSGRSRYCSTGIWTSVISVVVIPVAALIGLAFLGQFTFNTDFELLGASYERYERFVDVSSLNPVGAKDIYFSEESRRDYRISFWKMFMHREDYQRLLQTRKRMLSAESPDSFLQKADIEELNLAQFTANAPDWWNVPQHEADYSVHALNSDDGRGITKKLRGVWIYDDLSSTLWIVEK